jgi:hypothetical protein
VKIKPYLDINDLEINKEVGHLVQCKGVEYGFMDLACGCLHHEFFFDFHVGDV